MADAVRRLYVEKKGGFDVEAGAMLAELRDIIRIRGLRKLRLLNRYDVQGLDGEDFGKAVRTIFSEPPIDRVFHETAEFGGSERQIAIECLPGQYDQRADSAAQCAEVMTGGKRPLVRTARIVSLEGDIPPGDIEKARRYLINPIEAREASLGKPETLEAEFPLPPDVETVAGFAGMGDEALAALHARMKYAMAQEDLRFCRDYFRDAERRDPSATELKLIDTYWSDHCRHSTFLTEIGHAGFEPGCDSDAIEGAYREYLAVKAELGAGGGGKAGGGSGGAAGEAKSGGGGSSGGAEMGGGADTGGQTGGGAGGSGESGEGGAAAACLMDIATLAAKKLRRDGRLPALDASDENNACSIEVDADVAGEKQRWLVMFKNETHNHPTEIEPFGGAATCLGGAIRDPLSGRAYVYQAMRLTGSGDPREPVENTLPGKLPQRKITTSAAAGYSSYGNQIGIPTGYVREVYHPGYVAKRMEIGAVIGAAPKSHVRRGSPKPGDAIVLLGGRTGRDGIGGATGSSKEHTGASLLECGSEVQKGNPPAERKLLRFFRNPEAASMIIRCNDFGAGGVAVAIGELADGLLIDLDAVPKKYEGLDGTELAVSESQERMAVAVAGADAARFIELAGEENLEATVVAEVNDSGRVRMTWRGATIVDIARAFLDTNGVRQRTDVFVAAPDAGALAELLRGAPRGRGMETMDLAGRWLAALSDLNVCSQIGLASRFDSTVGANTVLMPFGGSRQLTPVEGMAAKLPVPGGDTSTATLMACGYDPSLSEASPFHGAVCAVLESLAKIAALGGDAGGAHLTLQEYFPKPGKSPRRWGLPFSAVLGAFYAQMRLSVAAIGGKDSMSGSFNELDVPPALVSFAVAVADAGRVISPEFKRAGSAVALLSLWGGGAGAAGASGAGCAGVAGAIGKGGASGAGAESGGAAGAKAGGADGCACERAGGEGGGSAGSEGGGGADAGAESGGGTSGDGASGVGCAGAAGAIGKGSTSDADAGAESGGFLPDLAGYMAAYRELCGAIGDGKVISAYPVRAGGVAAAVSLMCFGNGIGFEFDAGFDRQRLFARDYGAIVLELAGGAGANADEILPGAGLIRVGRTAEAPRIVFGPHMDMPLDEAVAAWSAPLGDIFPERSRGAGESGEPGVQSGESGEPG
ncbi:MAG: hypothetical protein LBL83_01640, partial [Clostridiales bacterium]|nr:hypothetical protein [Clostridiales bacterium]